jgi:hypothetical protein
MSTTACEPRSKDGEVELGEIETAQVLARGGIQLAAVASTRDDVTDECWLVVLIRACFYRVG